MKNDGFTLFEVITVLSLIGIVLAICIPKITTDFGYMDKIAEELLADVRFIQMESMKNPANIYQLTVNSSERKYYLRDGIKTVKTVILRERYSISYTGKGSLYFNYEGTPIYAGTFTILDDKTKKSKSVTVVPATGRTIILE